MKWVHTVNDIIRQFWTVILSLGFNTHQLRQLYQLSRCHTEALGGRRIRCQSCCHRQYIYHSCRNRHCPSCQGGRREEWISKQESYLLDVPYFHVVFTLPEELNQLCLYKPRQMYSLLFKASWETINTLSKDHKYLGAKAGMTAVLHTWSQTMMLHPHLHCIVPGGGVTKQGKWKPTRSKGKYLFPVKVMAQVYRAIFLKHLKQLRSEGVIDLDRSVVEKLYNKRWVVYCKRPFQRPADVIEYLGRYTHKIAMSNYRIVKITQEEVLFQWKDYRDGAKKKIMKLSIKEFLRRFAMHILPFRFVRIRHFGILSYHGRSKIIPNLQKQQGYHPKELLLSPKPEIILRCEKCKSEKLIVDILPRTKIRAP